MKYLIGLAFVISSVFAAEEKIYTEKEFQEKLQKEVAAKFEKIAGGSLVEFSKQLMEKEEERETFERLKYLAEQEKKDNIKKWEIHK